MHKQAKGRYPKSFVSVSKSSHAPLAPSPALWHYLPRPLRVGQQPKAICSLHNPLRTLLVSQSACHEARRLSVCSFVFHLFAILLSLVQRICGTTWRHLVVTCRPSGLYFKNKLGATYGIYVGHKRKTEVVCQLPFLYKELRTVCPREGEEVLKKCTNYLIRVVARETE